MGTTTATNLEQPQVIPSQGDLLGDLLNLDLGPPVNVPQVSSMQMGAVDLLGGGLDSLVSIFLLSFSSFKFFLFLNFYFQMIISSLEVAKTERSQCAFHPVSLHAAATAKSPDSV